MKVWLSSSLVRQFPNAAPPRGQATLSLYAARGERVSFQASVFVPSGDRPREVSLRVDAPGDLAVRVRRVGLVPVPHHNADTPVEELDGVGHIPGYVPDPLFPEETALVAPREVAAFWITVNVRRAARPGPKEIALAFHSAGERDNAASLLKATVLVSEVVLAKRKDFRVTHWFYADAICDWYGVEPFGEPFWPICEKYMKDYAEHGCDLIYVPVFTPPLDGVKRPTQLLKVRPRAGGRYSFDWRRVKRWIQLAQKSGIRHFEWTHFFTQWGCRNAIRVYEERDGKNRLLWPPGTGATSSTHRDFLAQFLPALERFLREERLLNASYFHVSDEPGGDSLPYYRKARDLLRELAPWMRVMDALSDVRFAREGLTDMPVPSIAHARPFVEEGIPSWAYFCCGPRGRWINRLLDTPLIKIRMTGWLLYRLGFGGFLHWGYNYWYRSQTQHTIDPFTVTDGERWPGWAYGDPFVVYPGPDGPIDSLRWEVFAESLQDYALLQTLGVPRDDRRLAPLKDFDDFPRNEKWLARLRKSLLGV